MSEYTNEQAPTSLCPGYKYVEKFADNEEYEGEEEVAYVTLDLGNVEPTLVPSSTEYRLIGLDTPTPYLQLQGTIFKGRHDMLLGTELVFTDNKDSQDRAKKPLIHTANIEQRIAFKEVTLVPKGSTHSGANSTSNTQAKKAVASSSKSSGKSKAKGKQKASASELGVENENEEGMADVPSGERALQIDRMTGLATEPARASRKRKSLASSTAMQSSGSAKGKEKAVESGRRQTRSRMGTNAGPSPRDPSHPPPLPEMQYSFPAEERQERMDVDMETPEPASRPSASSNPVHEFVIDPALLGPEEKGGDDMDDMYVDDK